MGDDRRLTSAITGHKRAVALFETAVEASPSGIVMTDASGKILLVNREAERLFGYDRAELLGQPVELLVPVRHREQHVGNRASFRGAPERRPMGEGRELYGRRKDGKEVPIEIGLNPVTTDEGTFVMASVVDITARVAAEAERQRLSDELRQAQKMEVLGTLAGGVAHDFNNTLGAIIALGELALEESSESTVRSDLAELLDAAKRGSQVVQRILAFSRKQAPRARALSLQTTVREALELVRVSLPANVQVRSAVGDRPLPDVCGDESAIHQILMNLCMNAAHAMPHGGAIRIAAQRVYVKDSVARALRELVEGEFVELSVSDSGVGIEASELERVFEPFYTTKAPGRGTGLGLAMVRRFMTDCGGAVRIESEPGVGTTVNCFFPVVTHDVRDLERDAAELERGNGERVLFVDDERILAQTGKRRLELLGYRVTSFTDPRRALALFEADPQAFDVVITDLSMPHLTGVRLAERIREIRPEIGIGLLTGCVDRVTDLDQRRSGGLVVMSKPTSSKDLGDLVRQLMSPRAVVGRADNALSVKRP